MKSLKSGKYLKVTGALIISQFIILSCGKRGTLPETPISPLPSSSSQPVKPISGDPEAPVVSQSIEEIYSPNLFFDSLEKDPMTSVEDYLQMGVSLSGRKGIGRTKVIKERATVQDLAQNTRLNVTIDGSDYELMLQSNDQITKPEGVVYTRKTVKNGSIYLQYWFFYSYNDTSSVNSNSLVRKCGNHQADWEHLSVRVNDAKFKIAKNDQDYLKAIEGIYFSQHNKEDNIDRKFRKYGDKDVSFDGTHVKAYPARGTHATYASPSQGDGYLLRKLLTLKLYDKADGRGLNFKSSGHLVALDSMPWNNYAGRWGKISDDICNIAEWVSGASNDGPIGPYQQNTGIDWDK